MTDTTSNRSSRMFVRCLFLVVVSLSKFVAKTDAQFLCTELASNTWAGFLQAIQESGRMAVLCPFQISGDGCPSMEEYPNGYLQSPKNNITPSTTDLSIVCDPFAEGQSRCVIDCPGRHFTVGPSSSLTLDTIVLMGATDTSIKVAETGSLEIINSDFVGNTARDFGGAIQALDVSKLTIQYSRFQSNVAGQFGGAIYSAGSSNIIQSEFEYNFASAAGGAVATDVEAKLDVQGTGFNENEADSGGAIFMAEGSNLRAGSNTFTNNAARSGGAIQNEGILSMSDSTFTDNEALQVGGAVNIDLGSNTVLKGCSFINNRSPRGPAVNDRFNTGVDKEDNTGCGNVAGKTGSTCDGVLVRVRRWVRCLPFEDQCIAPTQRPSSSPTDSPTIDATEFPSLPPTSVPTYGPTTTSPTAWPSIGHPSMMPSISRTPSRSPTLPSPPLPPPPIVPSRNPIDQTSEEPSSMQTVSPTIDVVVTSTIVPDQNSLIVPLPSLPSLPKKIAVDEEDEPRVEERLISLPSAASGNIDIGEKKPNSNPPK